MASPDVVDRLGRYCPAYLGQKLPHKIPAVDSGNGPRRNRSDYLVIE